MNKNPYQSPPESGGTPSRIGSRPPIRDARLSVLATLLVSSLVVAHLVTPADPQSTSLATIPIFLLNVLAYYFGLRHGRRVG